MLILFIVGFVWFNIVSLLRFPHLRVFVYALEPRGLWLGIWNAIRNILIHILGYIILFLVIMYFIWLFIKKVIPNFPIPLKMILLKIPPFPQLEKAGLFTFIGNILKAAFGGGRFAKRLKLVGITFRDFVARNTYRILAALGIKITMPITIGDTTITPAKPEKKRKSKKKKKFDLDAAQKMDDELVQCLEENLATITPDMSPNEKKVVLAKNVIARTVCKARSIQSWSRTIGSTI